MDTNKKIVILDIDGVLNDYPKSFLKWVEQTYGISTPNLATLKNNINYNDIKNNYRISGAKKYSGLTEGIIYLLEFLKSDDYYIWIITSRPVLAETVEFTEFWLRENKIKYDKLDFCRDKKSILSLNKNILKNIILAIDDSVEFLMGIEKISAGNSFPLILFTGNNCQNISLDGLSKRYFILKKFSDISKLIKTINP